jgi:hypothetical protein
VFCITDFAVTLTVKTINGIMIENNFDTCLSLLENNAALKYF